jgi:hypothetical protein
MFELLGMGILSQDLIEAILVGGRQDHAAALHRFGFTPARNERQARPTRLGI